MSPKVPVVIVLAAGFLPFSYAFALQAVEPRAVVIDEASASAFVGVGATTSAVFPVPNATNAAPEFDSFFPSATVVGFPGATPTGDEAEEIATAAAVPVHADAYPLVNPSTLDDVNDNDNNQSSSSFEVIRSWGNLSPMFSVDSFGLPDASELIPAGCELEQVHLLHRHGARYPTSVEGPAPLAAKLHNATVNGTGFTATHDLAFLNTWSYKLGAQLLTPFGRQQLFNLGVEFRIKYGELLKNLTGLPVFRTTSQERMVQSAQNFAAGFFGIPDFLTDYRQSITIEFWDPSINNTLNPFCANQDREDIGAALGNRKAAEWEAVYLQDAKARIQGMIEGDGLELDVSDVYEMQEACAYETVALGYSAFCDLFTEEEWKGFEYASDLLFWYAFGPGNPTTAATGIGYVQELVSRLSRTPIPVYNTTANATLDGSNITFPLDQSVYVDATHDTAITAILVAMNITSLAANGPLPTDRIPENQTYFANQLAPFAARLVGQVMTCATSPTKTKTPTKQIRWILNDGVLPLTGIAGCASENSDGLCALDTFVGAMQTRVGEVDYGFDCSANYTVTEAELGGIVDGRPPVGVRC